MAKTLELIFLTDVGQTMSISLEAPKEPIDTEKVREAMEDMISSDAFEHPKGKPVAIKGARLIDRTVTEYEI